MQLRGFHREASPLLHTAAALRAGRLSRPSPALHGVWARAASSTSSSSSGQSLADSSPNGIIASQLFVDLGFLSNALAKQATSRFGPQFAQVATVDGASFLPFLETRATEALNKLSASTAAGDHHAATAAEGGDAGCEAASSGSGPASVPPKARVAITHAYAYSSLSLTSALYPARVMIEQGIPVRQFDNFPDKTALGFMPSIALAADLVHAASVRAGVDPGLPALTRTPASAAAAAAAAAAGSVALPTKVIIAMGNSVTLAPPLIRAAQQGQTLLLATTQAGWSQQLLPALPRELAEAVTPLIVDDLLREMVVSKAAFTAAAPSLAQLADRLYAVAEAAAARLGGGAGGAETPVPRIELVKAVGDIDPGLVKDMRRAGTTLRSVLSAAGSLFQVRAAAGSGRGSNGGAPEADAGRDWEIALRPRGAAAAAPAAAAATAAAPAGPSRRERAAAAAAAAAGKAPHSNSNSSGKQQVKEERHTKEQQAPVEKAAEPEPAAPVEAEAAVAAAPVEAEAAAAPVAAAVEAAAVAEAVAEAGEVAAPEPAAVPAPAPADEDDAALLALVAATVARGGLPASATEKVTVDTLLGVWRAAGPGVPRPGALTKMRKEDLRKATLAAAAALRAALAPAA